MRICLVSREFAPFWGAGIGTYGAAMARAWAAGGHEVHVLSADHKGMTTNGPRLFPSVRFHAVEPLQSPTERAACVFDFQRYAMGVFRTLESLHERLNFTYVEFPDYWAEGYFALRAKRRLGKFQGVAIGVRLHTPSALCRELNQSPRLDDYNATLEHMEGSATADADLLLSPSESLLEWIGANQLPADDRPGAVVPYPFDVKEFATASGGMRRVPDAIEGPADESGLNEPKEILYFGRLERRKGVETFIEAGRRMIDSALNVRLRLIGGDTQSGPNGTSMLAHLKSRVYNYRPGAFVFEAARPRELLGEAIREATIVCLPSLWENFPNACLEAMSLRACVLGSDQGGMAEMIEDGVSGVLFQGGNATNLTATLRRVLADPELRATVSANAPKRVAKLCDPARVLAATLAAVESARAGPRVAERFDPGRAGADLQIPVPHIRADGAGSAGLVSRVRVGLRRLLGRR